MAITVKDEEEGPAIIALGPLFKLTEVFLWDHGSMGTKDRSFSKKNTNDGDDRSKSMDSGCEILQEEIELTKQMNDLGLPLSFGMNKEKRNRQTEGKRKDMPLKHSDTTQVVVGEELESCKVSVGETKSPIIFDDNAGSYLCCMPVMGQSELSSSDVVANGIKFQCPSVGGDTSASSAEITSDAAKEQGRDVILGIACNEGQDCDSLHSSAVPSGSMTIVAISTDLDNRLCPGSSAADASFSHDKTEPGERLMEHDHLDCSSMAFQGAEPSICKDSVPEQLCVSDSYSYSMCPDVLDQDGADGHGNGDLGDWMVYWDSYYERNYFYNIRTNTSTWYLPQGMEQLATVETTYKSNEAIGEAMEVDATSDFRTLDLCPNKTVSFEESINDDVSQGKPYCELSVGLELTTSDATLPTAPANICPGLSHEHNERNNTCNDESPSFLSSNFQDHDDSLSNTTHIEELCVDNMNTGTAAAAVNELEIQCDPSVVKRKKRVRRKPIRRNLSNEGEGLFKELSADVGKYWNQRYLLFSRYDDGIKMDEEGWFSVTPETLARHHAERCGSSIIIDCFTGVGGNSIQFAQKSKHVTAIDIDLKKIDYAKHNAAIYGVEDQIDFIIGDFFFLAPNLKADTIFLSPPWGGPDYAKAKIYDLKTMLKPYDGYFLFNTAKEVASTIVMFLPRNVDLNQLAELALSGPQPWSLEVEKNYLNGKLKGITAYFSDSTRI